MGEQRSNISHRVRRVPGPAIFSCTIQDLLTSSSRSNFRQRIGWIPPAEAGGQGKYDPWAVELLHKDYQGKFDRDTCFLSSELHLVRPHVQINHSFVLTALTDVRRDRTRAQCCSAVANWQGSGCPGRDKRRDLGQCPNYAGRYCCFCHRCESCHPLQKQEGLIFCPGTICAVRR